MNNFVIISKFASNLRPLTNVQNLLLNVKSGLKLFAFTALILGGIWTSKSNFKPNGSLSSRVHSN